MWEKRRIRIKNKKKKSKNDDCTKKDTNIIFDKERYYKRNPIRKYKKQSNVRKNIKLIKQL